MAEIGSTEAVQNGEVEDEPQINKNHSGLFGASSNIINIIIGTGVVGMPYAFLKTGLIAGWILLAYVGYLTDKSLRILVELAKFHPKLKNKGINNYETLAAIPFGKLGRGFVLVNSFILSFGGMIAYLLIVKQNLPTLFGVPANNTGVRNLIRFGTSFLIMLPLCILRDMASLAFTSMISVATSSIITIFIILTSPVKKSVSEAGGFVAVLRQDSLSRGLFIGLGIISTTLSCQQATFLISGSLKGLTRQRWSIVTGSSVGFTTLLYSILAAFGYLGYLGNTQSDFLENMPDNTATDTVRGLLSINMFFTYPMQCHVARHVISSLVYGGQTDDPIEELVKVRETQWCLKRRHVITIVLYVCTLIPALALNSLGFVLSFTGAIAASSICYIAPGLIYLGVNGESFVARCHSFLSKEPHNREEALTENGDWSLEYHRGCKPWWWWLLGYPIWYAVAFQGMEGMKHFHVDPDQVSSVEEAVDEGNILPEPKWYDYVVAIVFLFIFGVFALVVGVYSNIVAIV